VNLEIEAKISVPSLRPISNRLKEIGAVFVKRVRETDTYLKDSKARLLKRGCGLRLRHQTGPGGRKAFLTFKGPKHKTRYKTRLESETQISDFDATLRIFMGLGYKTAIVVQKTRWIWKLGSCLICLDDLPALGYFVEVEGPSEKQVEKTLRKLQLADLPSITNGYAKLTADALGKKLSK
jgi:adenylate cyclase class 2